MFWFQSFVGVFCLPLDSFCIYGAGKWSGNSQLVNWILLIMTSFYHRSGSAFKQLGRVLFSLTKDTAVSIASISSVSFPVCYTLWRCWIAGLPLGIGGCRASIISVQDGYLKPEWFELWQSAPVDLHGSNGDFILHSPVHYLGARTIFENSPQQRKEPASIEGP